MDMERIDQAVTRLWGRLVRHEKISIPSWQIESPESRPDLFSQPNGAWPVGQYCDHVWRLGDGSRIHAQCVSVGGQPMIRLHRDQYDPDHSFEHLVLHGLVETPIGPILGLALLVVLVGQASGT
jgi:hypothetical protein